LTFAGCRSAPTLELKRDTAADIKVINELLDQNIAAWNSNDAAAVADTFAGDAILMEPNLAALEGKEAIQGWYRALLKENVVRCAITPLETRVAGDWGYQRGNYTAVFTPKSGKPRVRRSRTNRQPAREYSGKRLPQASSVRIAGMAPDNARRLPLSDLPPAATKRIPAGIGNSGAIHVSV
jgi:uncharacterized protein (TIGR02246 family)